MKELGRSPKNISNLDSKVIDRFLSKGEKQSFVQLYCSVVLCRYSSEEIHLKMNILYFQ